MGVTTPVYDLVGRWCLNVLYTMIVDGLPEKKRDAFIEQVYRSPDEWAATARAVMQRNRAVLAELGEVG